MMDAMEQEVKGNANAIVRKISDDASMSVGSKGSVMIY
jgi:hypothetical protein